MLEHNKCLRITVADRMPSLKSLTYASHNFLSRSPSNWVWVGFGVLAESAFFITKRLDHRQLHGDFALVAIALDLVASALKPCNCKNVQSDFSTNSRVRSANFSDKILQ